MNATAPATDTSDRLDFVAASGLSYRVVYLPAADPARSVVKFYDRRYDFTPDGQFTGGSFYASTILERNPRFALVLDGGNPVWTLDAAAVRTVIEWLTARVA